ncbi:MAG: ADP-glyceromanno-heptose 6-epimerase [Armatimonadetes bacterium]|nr:ADP-glyceromanno-heptose 6-epimerase [Armatimonadota bacterium]
MSGKIIVTGGAGFIGSRLVRALNSGGRSDILIVDNLSSNPYKARNLAGLGFEDFVDKSAFIHLVRTGAFDQKVDVIFHQGACTDTLVDDEGYMMENNTMWSRSLLVWALAHGAKFIYASSAAVYGLGPIYSESERHISPLNIYGYSKLALDRIVESLATGVSTTMIGLRYFNVFGPGEAHKGRMASMVHQLARQVEETGVARIFGASPGFASGEQRRDFVHVDDIVALNLYFWQSDPRQGYVNAGTGQARTWNDLAQAVVATLGKGTIEHIPFPEKLLTQYQTHTQADLTRLRAWGCDHEFLPLETAVAQTLASPN